MECCACLSDSFIFETSHRISMKFGIGGALENLSLEFKFFFLTIRSRLHALRPGYGSCPYQYHATLAVRNVKNGVSSVCIQAVQKDVTEY
jgi:hypothetical protein